MKSDLRFCRAGLYIRLSKEDENDGPSQSVTNQRSLLNGFAEEHHLTVFDTYIDDGFSGTNFDRPGFRRMIADIEAGKVDLVITKDLSRLGRDYILTGHYMERYFPEHGVRYISLLDGIDTGVESSANDITPFRAILNDLYAKDISKKIKSVKHDKQRRGLFIGGKPMYGYQKHPTEKNRIVIDPEAAPVVRRIFSMAASGVSCRKIAETLNADAIPTPAVYAGLRQGKPGPYAGLWSGERISEMLRNETYLGNMVQGRQVKISYKSKKCRKQPPEDWVIVEGTHEPLVDAEVFRQAGRMLDSRRHTRSRKYDFLLKGLIFCHECGYPLGVMNRKNAAGEDRLFFVCRTYQRFPKAGVCTCHSIKEQTVTQAVLAKVREVCQSALSDTALLPLARSAVEGARSDPTEAALRSLDHRLGTLNASLDQMYLDKVSGLLAEEDFRRVYQKVQAERTQLETRREEWTKKSASPPRQEEEAQALVARFREEGCASREVLVGLIERIELSESKELYIQFRCKPPISGQAAANLSQDPVSNSGGGIHSNATNVNDARRVKTLTGHQN